MSVLAEITPSYEVVLVDDGSTDASWSELLDLADDPHVTLLRFTRNFGQQAATSAGLEESRGRWTVVIDCDLQEPPEVIPSLYARALEGYDVVFARRRRRRQTPLRRLAGRAYFALANALLGTRLDPQQSHFSIISARVREALLAAYGQDRHYLFALNWLSFPHSSIEFDHKERYAGRSSYTLRRLVRHGMEGFFFQTAAPLAWIIYLGTAIAISGLGLAAYFIVEYFTEDPYPYAGWTSLAVILLVLGGFIVISTGVTGLYVGWVFEQVKARPPYVVAQRLRGPATSDGPSRTGTR